MQRKPAQGSKKASTPASKLPSKKTATPKIDISALTKDWKELEKHVMICLGSYSQSHKRYKGHNQQSPAVCIVACAVSSLRPMNTWAKAVLDQILDVGTALHLKTRQISENRCSEHFEPPEIYKYFYLDDNKISIRVGIDVLAERVTRDSTILQKTEKLLDKFFLKNISGIFACQHMYFAIWRLGRNFFIFDSTEHNDLGGKWDGLPGRGFCYAIRVPNTKILANIILKNCPIKQINRFIIYPCKVEKVIKINRTPPETVEGHPPTPVEAPKPRPLPKTITTRPKKTEEPKPEPPPPPEEPQIEPKKSISQSRIPPQRPKLASVTKFVKTPDSTVGVLRASTHQRDPRFSRYNTGAQSIANAIAALTMLRQYKSRVWIRKILDDILKLGEVIHHELKSLPKGEILTKITLNNKDYNPKIDRMGCVGRLTSDDDKIFSLEQALTNVLIDTDCCILQGPNTVAIWKENDRFFMFDPEERGPGGLKLRPGDPPGVACVTWFKKPADLVNLYLNNVPKTSIKDRFVISKVAIKDFIQRPENWFNFKPLAFNKWLLRGNFSQADKRFGPESRNAQCTANATMALTFKELKEEKDWDDRTVDDVLLNGDEFYRASVNALQEAGRFKHKYLMVDEVNRSFDLENKKVNLEIDDCLVNGIICAKSDAGIPNLKTGFEQFFTDSEAGIVTANFQSMAVWKRDDTYFYYDSHSRDEKGIVCGYGTACIFRLLTIEDLTKVLVTNLGADTQNFFNISRVVVKLFDLTDEGVVKPPLNNYDAVNEFVAILRSTWSEKDKKFDIKAGKQTVGMCLAALAFNTLTPAFDWSREDLDQVLVFGDGLYKDTMEEIYSAEDNDDVTTTNVKKEITIGSNLISFELEDSSSGNFEDNLKDAIEGLNTRVGEEGNEVFQTILESEWITVSFWRDDNLFYLFDSKPRDEKGQIYGKDEWSAKIVVEEEVIEDVPEKTEVQEGEESEEIDEMAGGDNLGPEPEPLPVPQPQPEPEEEEELDVEDEDEDEDEEKDEEAPQVVKKGSDFWRLKEQEGKACVLRFSKTDDLIQHLLENTPPNKRQDTEFVLKTVKITNTPVVHEIFDPEVDEKTDEISGDWFEFKEVDHGKWILRSTRNFQDGLFPVCNRGKQAFPMCIVSMAFAHLYDLRKFSQDVVDNILSYGDRLFTVLRKLRAKDLKESLELQDDEVEEILKQATFNLGDYPKNICMEEKLAMWESKFEVILGDITSKEPESVPDVLSGLTKFFEEYKFGILVCKDYPVAVWKEEDIFYMFDPHPNGPSGLKSPVGVSCITRFINLEDLVQIFLKNLPRLGNNIYEIHSFTFTQEKCVRERHPEEKIEKLPKLGGFNLVMAGKSIIRGDIKLDCTKFDRGVHVNSAAIAFVVLALSLSKEAETWTRIIIREILTVGEELHNESVEKLGDKFDPWKHRLDVCQVKNDFNIGKLKVNTALRFKEQRGIVDVKNSKTLNLRQGLEKFFEENSHGILVADKFVLPLWEQAKGEDVWIYMFDPNSRGPTGLPSQGGSPCIMKFCNAKVASDHIKACMLDVDKARTEFRLVPVEIAVGSLKTRRKVCEDLIKPPEKKQEKVKCPDLATLQEAKRKLRQTAEEQRKEAEARRCYALGRNEIYQISKNEAIVRALRACQPDRDLPVTVAALILMKISADLNKWTYKQPEVILETGYQLYVDSYNAYKPMTSKLTLQHILRRVLIRDLEAKIDIKRPVNCGRFTRENVMAQVSHLFTATNCCLLTYEESIITLYFKGGYYYIFDPYSRDLNGNKCDNGTAVMLRFGTIESMAEKIIRNFASEKSPPKSFALIVAGVLSVQRLTK